MALSDPQGILATPLTVLASADADVLTNEIVRLVDLHKVERIVVGLPRRLSGDLGKQADKVVAFTERLSCLAKERGLARLDIQLWDERLSTKAAERLKREPIGRGGSLDSKARRGRGNRSPGVKAEVDAIAAALILQGFLDSHHSEGS